MKRKKAGFTRTNSEISRFIILVPHRDTLKILEEYQARLFASGFYGAYSFPGAAPLANISRPFSREELRELGRNIRLSTGNWDGKILSNGIATVDGPGSFSFYGPRLSLSIEEDIFPGAARDKVLRTFVPTVLCAGLGANEKPNFDEPPALSFRAAALANLAIRPLPGGEREFSYEWRISPLVWLPKYRAKP